MRKKIILFSIFLSVHLFLSPHSLYSERLNRETKLKPTSIEKPVVVLYAGLNLDSDYPSNEYVRVQLFVLVQDKDFVDGERIRKGTILADTTGKFIGKALADFDALVFDHQSPTRVIVRIRGYIPREAIDPASIPEFELDTLVRNIVDVCDAKTLLPHIKKFKYKHALSYEGFSSYIKNNAELIGSPGLRVLIVFYNQELFAIIHPNTITISQVFPFKKDYNIIQYFTKNEILIKKFEKGFLFQYNSTG